MLNREIELRYVLKGMLLCMYVTIPDGVEISLYRTV